MAQEKTTDDPHDILSGFYREVPGILEELYHYLPYDKEFTTSSGRPYILKKFTAPRPNPETEVWEFGFDVSFKDDKSPDHLEFFIKHTGGGGAWNGQSVDD